MFRGGNHLAKACAVALLACTSCALQAPKPTIPEVPVAFDNGTPAGRAAWPGKDWYHGFASPELDALITQATNANLDLAGARARLIQADARARQAGAAILPSVDALGNGNFLAGHSTNGGAHELDWSALLSASYEVDFWGKNRATANAARQLDSAARADRDTLALTTLAGVADGYFELLSIRERQQLAQSNLDTARGLLEVVQARFNAGASDPVTLATQRSVLAAAQLVLPDLRQREAEALTALALLVGRQPEGFQVPAAALDSLVEPQIAPGLPVELLTRRPDVYSAEANLRAADADLVAARAAMLPSLTLTAAGGIQNPAVNAAVTVLAGTGPGLNLGAGLTQSIFDHGRLRAVRDEARARDDELLASYRKAILSALVDVENALAAIHNLDVAREFQSEGLAQSQLAFDGAQLRYRQGAGDFLTVLEAQRTLYAARDQYSQYKLARLQALVGLCKALGGGWELQE
ncbi:MAG TPA: efflux transporter outer membrane subunit [Steroidobacteraceae bacterium]|nr:efflux transporter outer membrane subunit [Steroidobacteraceae bacterium]